ncbi:MAG TPA: family 10 glycosylhydrolase [Gemmatimonadaceae bacterium]|nr:family 10 glycosylhydrolase [Gemmatimonadaceae bacterium]
MLHRSLVARRHLAALALLLPAALPAQPVAPTTATTSASAPPAVQREFRGAWVASVANIDWPSRPGLSGWEQQAELIAMLDRAVALNLNAVVLQVRPAADALYDSPYEPWSEYLTGVQGRAPEPYYDPLAFAVEAAHARGLELHTWFNPYRARHPSAKGPAARTHVSVARPELVREYGGYQWMDPGEPAVRAQTLRVILDVVRRYDVDGVHMDDYFYPYPVRDSVTGNDAPFSDSASFARYVRGGGRLARDDWRRRNVDLLMEEVYRGVRAAKPWVKVGISPFGIWRPGYPAQIQGFDAYEKLYADSRKWLREGWVDYFVPQLYWPIAQTPQSYPVLLAWWATENVKGRHLWPGHNTSRAAGTVWPPDELLEQIRLTRAQDGATGDVHFSMRALMPRPAAPRDSVALVGVATPPPGAGAAAALADRVQTELYAAPALVPASPWLARGRPARPTVKLRTDASGAHVARLTPGGKRAPRWWTVRVFANGAWHTRVLPGSQRSVLLTDAGTAPERVLVTAVDRYGTESAVAEVAAR